MGIALDICMLGYIFLGGLLGGAGLSIGFMGGVFLTLQFQDFWATRTGQETPSSSI